MIKMQIHLTLNNIASKIEELKKCTVMVGDFNKALVAD